MLFTIALLLASIKALIPITCEFKLSGVDPDSFSDLGDAIGAFLEIDDSPKLIDYDKATPTPEPTAYPTSSPTINPTATPTPEPTLSPTDNPTQGPTDTPTQAPSQSPTATPTTVRRRQLSNDDLYILIYIIYLDDKEAADALITSVGNKNDTESALASEIAAKLDMDPADVNVNSVVI